MIEPEVAGPPVGWGISLQYDQNETAPCARNAEWTGSSDRRSGRPGEGRRDDDAAEAVAHQVEPHVASALTRHPLQVGEQRVKARLADRPCAVLHLEERQVPQDADHRAEHRSRRCRSSRRSPARRRSRRPPRDRRARGHPRARSRGRRSRAPLHDRAPGTRPRPRARARAAPCQPPRRRRWSRARRGRPACPRCARRRRRRAPRCREAGRR